MNERKEGMKFQQPADENAKVWRYMDTSKFIWLISNNKLYFPRSDLLEDKFEGSITKITQELRNEKLKEHPEYSPQQIQDYSKDNRKGVFVNSWRMDEHESEAMWKLYCPNNEGIAIQTKYSSLTKAFNNRFSENDVDNSSKASNVCAHRKYNNSDELDEYDVGEYVNIYAGCISYKDYEREVFPINYTFSPQMYKRRSFEHEKEVRMILLNTVQRGEYPPDGFIVDWNALGYIENIYVNPYTPKWYYQVVLKIIKSFAPALDSRVSWSSEKIEPVY